MTSTHRQSNIELLRLVAMAFILIHHFVAHGLGLFSLSANQMPEHIHGNGPMMLFSGLNSFCIVAVNVFFLISGYFGIKTSKSKVFSILFQLFFYSFIFLSIPTFIFEEDRLSSSIYTLFFVSKSPYWFMVVYVVFMGFAPLINQFFEHSSRKSLATLCLFLVLCSCYSGFVWENHYINPSGYSIFQFFSMYCIGRYINKYEIHASSGKMLLIYTLCCLGTWLAQYFFISTETKLLYWTPRHLAWKMTYYNSPLVMGAAICLFLAFKNLNLQSHLINTLAKSSLAIYLIQESYLARWEYSFIGHFADSHSTLQVIGLLGIFLLVFLCLAFLIDPLRRGVSNLILKTISLRSSNHQP